MSGVTICSRIDINYNSTYYIHIINEDSQTKMAVLELA